LAKVGLPLFVDDFHPKMNLILDKKTYIFALTHSPRLSSGDPPSMVYELFEIVLSMMTLLVALNSFLNMQAHHSWSCSSISITPAYCIMTIGFE
jgi:hypothetical protein